MAKQHIITWEEKVVKEVVVEAESVSEAVGLWEGDDFDPDHIADVNNTVRLQSVKEEIGEGGLNTCKLEIFGKAYEAAEKEGSMKHTTLKEHAYDLRVNSLKMAYSLSKLNNSLLTLEPSLRVLFARLEKELGAVDESVEVVDLEMSRLKRERNGDEEKLNMETHNVLNTPKIT